LIPLAFLPENHALAIAIISYNGALQFGLLADYDAMPDIDFVAESLEAALAELLEAGAIRGAGLDVLGTEPPPPDNPLLTSPRVVLTPHVAFNTAEASSDLLRIALENLLAFARGEPQNVVA